MMAPRFDRARMLGIAIDAAARELDEPIDRVEVVANKVLVWAGEKRLAMKCRFTDSSGEQGPLRPGAGQWEVEIERSGPPAAQVVAYSMGRLASRLWRSINQKD